MKNLKQIRESYNLITEKEEHDMNKLSQLVRAGLFDAKKLSALKRAMDKPADKMTAQEKRMMINLLDALMAEVLSDKQVYRKIKQDVMKEAKEWETKDYLSKNDPRFGRGYPPAKDVPSVLLLKRKAIRVFPDGQKVALYYAQAIDKYVSIPFSEIGINEEIQFIEEEQLDEFVGPLVKGAIAAGGAALRYGKKVYDASKAAGKTMAKSRYKRELGKKVDDAVKAKRAARRKDVVDKLAARRAKGKNPFRGGKSGKLRAAAGAAAAGGGDSGSSSTSSTNEPKYFTPMSSKAQATISKPERTTGSDARAERERQASLRASKSMANEAVSLELDGNLFEINNKAAQKVTSLYESLNKRNKKKMIGMMKESAESLEKIVSFAVRQ